MKKMRYILGLGVLSLAALSCTKVGPMGPDQAYSPTISIAAEAPATKGFIDGKFPEGGQITVYDWLDVVSGTDYYHMSGVGARYNGGEEDNWSYTNEKDQYRWLDGTHYFFGWLTGDGSADGSSYVSFDSGKKILTVNEYDFTTRRDYDFVYSDVVEREYAKGSTSNDISRVMLPMHHVFSAFQFKVTNMRNSAITINSITLKNLKTEKSATISYSNNGNIVSNPNPVYTTSGSGNITDTGINTTLNQGGTTTLFDEEFYMIWPQTEAELDAAEVEIIYNTNQKATIPLTALADNAQSWDAGKRYSYTLTFKDKEIQLICVVMEWIPQEEIIDFSDQVTVDAPITWDESTVRSVNYETGEVILFDDTSIEATCHFNFTSPKGATWTASLIPIEGHQDAFEFVGSTKYGAVGVDTPVQLRVTNQAPIAPRHICYLRITIQTADGRTIVVKNMIAGKDNQEFKVIQNLING